MSKIDNQQLYQQLSNSFDKHKAVALPLAKQFAEMICNDTQWRRYKMHNSQATEYNDDIEEVQARLDVGVHRLKNDNNARMNFGLRNGYEPGQVTRIENFLEAAAAGAIIGLSYQEMSEKLFEEGTHLSYKDSKGWEKALFGRELEKEDVRAYIGHTLRIQGVHVPPSLWENWIDLIEDDPSARMCHLISAGTNLCLDNLGMQTNFINRTEFDCNYAITILQRLNCVVTDVGILPERIKYNDKPKENASKQKFRSNQIEFFIGDYKVKNPKQWQEDRPNSPGAPGLS